MSNSNKKEHQTMDKIINAFKSLYQKINDQLKRIIPPPTVQRNVNPYIAAALELLGYIGLLGLGRMYAGDVAGGMSALMMWLVVLAGTCGLIFVAALVALVLAIPTLGLSFILVGFLGLLIFPVIILPALSAIQLFTTLKVGASHTAQPASPTVQQQAPSQPKPSAAGRTSPASSAASDTPQPSSSGYVWKQLDDNK
jgi:hypothetical protein